MQVDIEVNLRLCMVLLWGKVLIPLKRIISRIFGVEKTFPYEIVEPDKHLIKSFVSDFKGQSPGFVCVGPEKWTLPLRYKKQANELWNFQARSSDVFICGFPRSGTTLTQEMVWLLCNNLDFETARTKLLNERVPSLEYNMFIHGELFKRFLLDNSDSVWKTFLILACFGRSYDMIAGFPYKERRFIKSHLPFCLLPPSIMENQAKVIYIARHPRDVVVSYFHLNKLFRPYDFAGDFECFSEYFMNSLNIYGSYFEHIKQGWMRRNEENVLFVFYEDLRRDMKNSLMKVANFLDKQLNDDDIRELQDHLNIENCKVNPAFNSDELIYMKAFNTNVEGFIRHGKSGELSRYSGENIKKLEKWIDLNLQEMKKVGLLFPQSKLDFMG